MVRLQVVRHGRGGHAGVSTGGGRCECGAGELLAEDELDGGLVDGEVVARLALQLVRVAQGPHELPVLDGVPQVALAEDEHEDGHQVVGADVDLVVAPGLQTGQHHQLELAVDRLDGSCQNVQLRGRGQVQLHPGQFEDGRLPALIWSNIWP